MLWIYEEKVLAMYYWKNSPKVEWQLLKLKKFSVIDRVWVGVYRYMYVCVWTPTSFFWCSAFPHLPYVNNTPLLIPFCVGVGESFTK